MRNNLASFFVRLGVMIATTNENGVNAVRKDVDILIDNVNKKRSEWARKQGL